MRLCLVLAAAAVAAPASPAEPPDWAPNIAVRVDRDEVHLGDPVTVTVTAIHGADVRVRLAREVGLGKLTLLDRADERTDLGDGRVRSDIVLHVAAYELGALEVPPLDVIAVGPGGGATHAIRTESLPIAVVGLIGREDDPVPRPSAPPVPLLVRDWRAVWGAAGLAGIAVLAAGLWWWRRRRARRRALAAGPGLPAHIVALRALRALERSDLLARDRHQAFHLKLSEILRAYLGRRYGFEAIESTTSEVLDHLRRARPDGLDLLALHGVLSLSDLAKFAKHRPPAETSIAALTRALDIVESTRPRPEIGTEDRARAA